MAKKNTDVASSANRQGSGKKESNRRELKEEARYSIWGIGFVVLGIIILLSVFNMAGVVGDFIFRAFSAFFGLGYYVLPILLMYIGYSFFKK